MLPTPCVLFGDAHLGIASAASESQLRAFLRGVHARARSLVIMGDLFDFWFAWEHAMPQTGYRVLAELAQLRDDGMEVLWLGGNHDCWGGDTLQALTGATYRLDEWRGEIGQWQVLLAHGDGLREVEDRPYRRVRTVLRHPLAIRAYGWLHPNLSTKVALRTSKTSRHHGARDGGKGLQSVAQRRFEAEPALDLIVNGHSHVPAMLPLSHGVYANAGAWYLDPQYLVVTDDTITRYRWTGSGEGDLLDSIDRPPKKATA